MSIRRVVPNLPSNRFEESRDFYTGLLGFEVAMDMGWVMTLVSSSHPLAQITLLQDAGSEAPHPAVSIEVDDVDKVHTQAEEGGWEIVYPLTDEPWGVKRFFVKDPNGVIINVMSHSG